VEFTHVNDSRVKKPFGPDPYADVDGVGGGVAKKTGGAA